MSEDQVLQDLLRQELKILDKSISHILYSQAKVQAIDLNASLSPDELELFDSFSSRFLRLYEVLYNQVIRTTLGLFKEVQKTTLDNMNKAEQLDKKVGIVGRFPPLAEPATTRAWGAGGGPYQSQSNEDQWPN